MTLVLLATLGAAALGGDRTCTGTALSSDELLTRAHAALDLAGTMQVVPGSAPGCVAITVRSFGTARLVWLVLRGVNVPDEAAEIVVVKQSPGGES